METSKKELLNNLHGYTPEEIADAIRAGIVTFEELANDTDTPSLKTQVEDILSMSSVPKEKPKMVRHPFSFRGRIRRQEYINLT